MSLSFSDIIALASVGLGVSALGLAIDSMMVPRLERHRDRLIDLTEETLSRGSKASEILKDDKDLSTKLGKAVGSVESLSDDLSAKHFFIELRSIVYFRGSIVRALLIALAIQTGVILFATLYGMATPWVDAAFASVLQSVPNECSWVAHATTLPQVFQSTCRGGMSLLAIITVTILCYTTFCLWIYLSLWKKEQSRLLLLEKSLLTVSREMSLYGRLAEFAAEKAMTNGK